MEILGADPYVILAYAKAGMPGAELIEVWDLVHNREIRDIVECDARGGWAVRYVRGPTGGFLVKQPGNTPVVERLEGRFEIRKYLAP